MYRKSILELTVENINKVCILQQFVGDINVAMMIVKDSHYSDTYLDDKIMYENEIRTLRQKENKQRTDEELEALKMPQLIQICRHAKIRGFSKLPNRRKASLIKFIQLNEYNSLVKLYRKEFYETEFRGVCQEIQFLIDAQEFSKTVAMRVEMTLELLQYILKNEMFLFCHQEFHQSVLGKLTEFESHPNIKDNETFIDLVRKIRQM